MESIKHIVTGVNWMRINCHYAFFLLFYSIWENERKVQMTNNSWHFLCSKPNVEVRRSFFPICQTQIDVFHLIFIEETFFSAPKKTHSFIIFTPKNVVFLIKLDHDAYICGNDGVNIEKFNIVLYAASRCQQFYSIKQLFSRWFWCICQCHAQ